MLTPLVTNLKLDPFERFDEARRIDEWQENRAWTYALAVAQFGTLVQTLKVLPPRMACLDFGLDEAMTTLAPNPQ